MARWPRFLLAILYLLPQAGVALHHEEEPAACAACPGGPAFECAGENCEDGGHHHHERHTHAAGACRTCSAADVAALDAPSLLLSLTASAFAAEDVDPPSPAAQLLGRPIRAPPAA